MFSFMIIGIVGKPSSGKTTILNALCMTDAKMGAYPFTTITPNRGIAYVRVPCPCRNLETSCNPRTGSCQEGTRYVPIEVLDVAGLVPGASEGKGLGNQFLDDLRQANVLIHVLDASGTTDAEGNDVDSYNPVDDIIWLHDELVMWIHNILFAAWERISKRMEIDLSKMPELIQDKLSGLGATLNMVQTSLREADIREGNPRKWSDEDKKIFASKLCENIFPIVIAANKIDKPGADGHMDSIRKQFPNYNITETSGLAELTLRRADEKNIIRYLPGSDSFHVLTDDLDNKFLKVVQTIKEKLLDTKGSTGVVQMLETTTFDILEMIAVFPVEDQSHLTDADGRILPDVYLVPTGTTAKTMAGKVHSDLAKHFIHAILVNKSNKRVSANHELEHGDILKIVSSAK